MAAIAGCGGNGGGSSQAANGSPRKQVLLYLAAFSRGDGKAACALLTPTAQAGIPHLSDQIKSPDCEGAIRELSRASERLRAPSVTVREQGNRAFAKIRNSHPPYQSDVLLDRQDGGWLIAFPSALLERFKTPPGIKSELK